MYLIRLLQEVELFEGESGWGGGGGGENRKFKTEKLGKLGGRWSDQGGGLIKESAPSPDFFFGLGELLNTHEKISQFLISLRA